MLGLNIDSFTSIPYLTTRAAGAVTAAERSDPANETLEAVRQLVMIPDSQWSWITDHGLPSGRKVQSLWGRVVPYLSSSSGPEISKAIKAAVYKGLAEGAYSRNRLSSIGSQTNLDIWSFNRALELSDSSDRLSLCYRVGQSYALRHLPSESLKESFNHKDLVALNEEIHHMQMAAISMTDIIETAFAKLGKRHDTLQKTLEAASHDGSDPEAIGGLAAVSTHLSALRQVVSESYGSDSRSILLFGKEMQALSSLMELLIGLESRGRVPEEVNDFHFYATIMQAASFLRATAYERMGQILGFVFEQHTHLRPHLSRRWLLTALTSEECYSKAYRDYSLADAISSGRSRHGACERASSGDDQRTITLCQDSLKRCINYIASNPYITDSGNLLVRLYGPKHHLLTSSEGSGSGSRQTQMPSPSLEAQGPRSLSALAMHDSPKDRHQDDPVRGLLDTARYHLSHENLLPAIEVYKKVVEQVPNGQEYLHTLAQLYAGIDDLSKAIACYEKELALSPDDGSISRELGALYHRNGNYQQALVHLIRADKLSPGDSHLVGEIADEYLLLGNYKEAIRRYEQAVSLEPDISPFKELLHNCCISAGDYHYFSKKPNFNDAVEYYSKATVACPTHYGNYLNRAIEAYIKIDRPDRAAQLYERCREVFPHQDIRIEASAYVTLAQQALNRCECRVAIGHLNNAMAVSPGHALAQEMQSRSYYQLAMQLLGSKHTDAAIDALRNGTANTLLPKAHHHVELAELLIDRARGPSEGTESDYLEAIAHVQQSLELDEGNAEAHHLLAHGLEATGEDPTEAIRLAVRYSPTNLRYRWELVERYRKSDNPRWQHHLKRFQDLGGNINKLPSDSLE